MPTSSSRLLSIVLLTLIGLVSQHVPTSAQEPDGGRRPGGRREIPGLTPPTYAGPESSDRIEYAQFGRGELHIESNAGELRAEQPRELIELSLWDVTVANSAAPEADALVGQLIDKAESLPPVIGTTDEVRRLVSRLKAAGVVRALHEYRLMTMDGGQVTSQTGADNPTIITTINSTRGKSNSIQYRDVGTLITATPHIDTASRIQVLFKFAASSLETAKSVVIDTPTEGPPIYATRTTTFQFDTQVRLKSGTAALLRSDASYETGSETPAAQTRLIILGATVLPTLDEAEINPAPQSASRVVPDPE